MLGEFCVTRAPAELLSELADPLTHFQQPFLNRPLDMDLPPLVAEVPLDLAGDAGLRVSGQAAADTRVEVVDRLEQAHVADLHQVLVWLGAAPVTVGARADQAAVPPHQHLTGGGALGAAGRLGPDHAE